MLGTVCFCWFSSKEELLLESSFCLPLPTWKEGDLSCKHSQSFFWKILPAEGQIHSLMPCALPWAIPLVVFM